MQDANAGGGGQYGRFWGVHLGLHNGDAECGKGSPSSQAEKLRAFSVTASAGTRAIGCARRWERGLRYAFNTYLTCAGAIGLVSSGETAPRQVLLFYADAGQASYEVPARACKTWGFHGLTVLLSGSEAVHQNGTGRATVATRRAGRGLDKLPRYWLPVSGMRLFPSLLRTSTPYEYISSSLSLTCKVKTQNRVCAAGLTADSIQIRRSPYRRRNPKRLVNAHVVRSGMHRRPGSDGSKAGQ